MKKKFEHKKPRVKVAKLNRTPLENGIIVLISILLFANLILSLKVLFG